MPVYREGLIELGDVAHHENINFKSFKSQKLSTADITTMKKFWADSNNLVLINSPNKYLIIHVKFSFWSDSTTNLNSLLTSFRLVQMNGKVINFGNETSNLPNVTTACTTGQTEYPSILGLPIKTTLFNYLNAKHSKHPAHVIKLCNLGPFV
jgi:hypothetical protein